MEYYIGFDPGLTTAGIVVLSRQNLKFKIESFDLIKTKKNNNKKQLTQIRTSVDDMERVRYIFKRILKVLKPFQSDKLFFGYEHFNLRPGMGKGGKTAYIAPLIICASVLFKNSFILPFIPMDIKMKFTGKRSSSKDDVFQSLKDKLVNPETFQTIKEKDIEHISDACCLAILTFEEIKKLKKLY